MVDTVHGGRTHLALIENGEVLYHAAAETISTALGRRSDTQIVDVLKVDEMQLFSVVETK